MTLTMMWCVRQIYNVYSLGLAILSVIFLQWLLLYERRQHHHHHRRRDDDSSPSASLADLRDYGARSASPDVVLPSITVVPPSPTPSDGDEDAETALVEPSSPAPAPVDAELAGAAASSDASSDDYAPETLTAVSSAPGRRRASEASANVLQLINEQRRFSVSANSGKSATAGGVTG